MEQISHSDADLLSSRVSIAQLPLCYLRYMYVAIVSVLELSQVQANLKEPLTYVKLVVQGIISEVA